MDIFNTKKIAVLETAHNDLIARIRRLEEDNKSLKQSAFEQHKKANKPKFKIGDKIEYNNGCYNRSGIVFNIAPDFNCCNTISYYYDISACGEPFRVIEDRAIKVK